MLKERKESYSRLLGTCLSLQLQKAEARGSQVQGKPGLHREFQASPANLLEPYCKIKSKREVQACNSGVEWWPRIPSKGLGCGWVVDDVPRMLEGPGSIPIPERETERQRWQGWGLYRHKHTSEPKAA